MAGKKTKGRRKIPMAKIADVASRRVTFSKRRGGLFKKASELCALTGAEIAILVISESGRVYSFGHPSADAVIARGGACMESERGRRGGGEWWEQAAEGMGVEELEEYAAALEGLARNVELRASTINPSNVATIYKP